MPPIPAEVFLALLLSVNTAGAISILFHIRNGRYSSAILREQRVQTDYLQRIFHLQSKALRPAIEADQQRRILDSLLQSGMYDTREARDALAAACPDKLRDSLSRNNIPRLDLQQIVQRAARWDGDCLLAVLDQAVYDLNGSAAGKELQAIRAELQPFAAD